MVVDQREPPQRKGGSALKGCLSYSTRLSNLRWTRGVPAFPTTGYGTTDFRATEMPVAFRYPGKIRRKVGRHLCRKRSETWEGFGMGMEYSAS